MLKWTPFPLIRITTALSAGILYEIGQPTTGDTNLLTLVALVFFGLAAIPYFFREQIAGAGLFIGIPSFLSCLFCGMLLVATRTDTKNANHILHLKDSIMAYEAKVSGHFEVKKNSYHTTVSVIAVRTSRGWRSARGKINCYFAKESVQPDLIWGDHIVVNGAPRETSGPANPHEFDYKRFLAFKNIYHQQYVGKGQWLKTRQYDPSALRYSAQVRDHFASVIKKYVHGGQEQAVSLALVIGVTDGIDTELTSAYAASGAMHVLAVSGLHVGIIYVIILFFLKPLQNSTQGRWFVSFISLAALWSYAFVTGLSPSVLRAVMMFSFVALARPLNTRSNIYNTLAGSAFVLLILDPYLIMSVGFQLSYLAVLGIIWIQRPLYLLFEAANGPVDWVWKTTCVSMAAQATTFSLSLLYFHQFPTYFLFSNLAVIPLSTLVLVAGLVLLAVSFMDVLATGAGWILEGLSRVLNYSVFFVEDLPFNRISEIYVDPLQSWLILGLLSSLIFLFQFKKMPWLYVAVGLAVAVSISRWAHFQQRMAAHQFVVYSVAGSTAFEITERGQSYFVADSLLLAEEEKMRFHIQGNRLFNLVNCTKTNRINARTDSLVYIRAGELTFLLLNHVVKSFPEQLKPDYVIVSRGGMVQVAEIGDRYPDTVFVLDGTIGTGYSRWLKPTVGDRADRIYSVREKGAWVCEL